MRVLSQAQINSPPKPPSNRYGGFLLNGPHYTASNKNFKKISHVHVNATEKAPPSPPSLCCNFLIFSVKSSHRNSLMPCVIKICFGDPFCKNYAKFQLISRNGDHIFRDRHFKSLIFQALPGFYARKSGSFTKLNRQFIAILSN